MDSNIDKVREALDYARRFSDNIGIEYRCNAALAALSTIDHEEIRREALQSVRKEIEEWRDDITCCDYDEGYLDGTENALKIIDAAILSAEPAQDDGKLDEATP